MATPRKHWFKTADSILWESWSDSQLATLTRLSAYMNIRRAREKLTYRQACVVALSLESARLVCKRTHRADCERSLSALKALLSIEVRAVGECFEIKWPKWAKYQETEPRKSPASRPRASRKLPAPTPAPAPYKKRRTPTPIDPEADRSELRLLPTHDCLPADRLTKLAAMKPHGAEYTREQVAAWYAKTAPEIRAREYPKPWLATISWWRRAKRAEVDDAMNWVASDRGRAAQAAESEQGAPRWSAEQIARAEEALGV